MSTIAHRPSACSTVAVAGGAAAAGIHGISGARNLLAEVLSEWADRWEPAPHDPPAPATRRG